MTINIFPKLWQKLEYFFPPLRPANTPMHHCMHACIDTHTVSASESHIQQPWWSTFSRLLQKLGHFMSPAPQNMYTNTVSVQVSHTSLTPTQNSTAPLTLERKLYLYIYSGLFVHLPHKLDSYLKQCSWDLRGSRQAKSFCWCAAQTWGLCPVAPHPQWSMSPTPHTAHSLCWTGTVKLLWTYLA